MSAERLARLFVGIGFLWMAFILIVALLAGFDKPTAWLGLLSAAWENQSPWYVYLGLTLFVVPVGMLTLLRDILGDPAALWMKLGAPGAFVAFYCLFLLAALPDIGRPFLLAFDSITPFGDVVDAPSTTTSWLLRFVTAFGVLAGIPGLVGVLLKALAGDGSARGSG